MKHNKYIYVYLLQIVVGAIFVISALGKITARYEFYESINNYKIFPIILAKYISIIFPYIELVVGSLMILNKYVFVSSIIICLMLVGFEILMISAIIRGINNDCGCFGQFEIVRGGGMIFPIIRNVMLFGICIVIIWNKKVEAKGLNQK